MPGLQCAGRQAVEQEQDGQHQPHADGPVSQQSLLIMHQNPIPNLLFLDCKHLYDMTYPFLCSFPSSHTLLLRGQLNLQQHGPTSAAILPFLNTTIFNDFKDLRMIVNLVQQIVPF